MRLNIQAVGQTYEQIPENFRANKNGQTDGEDIRNCKFKWRNPWCHVTLAINDMY